MDLRYSVWINAMTYLLIKRIVLRSLSKWEIKDATNFEDEYGWTVVQTEKPLPVHSVDKKLLDSHSTCVLLADGRQLLIFREVTTLRFSVVPEGTEDECCHFVIVRLLLALRWWRFFCVQQLEGVLQSTLSSLPEGNQAENENIFFLWFRFTFELSTETVSMKSAHSILDQVLGNVVW